MTDLRFRPHRRHFAPIRCIRLTGRRCHCRAVRGVGASTGLPELRRPHALAPRAEREAENP